MGFMRARRHGRVTIAFLFCCAAACGKDSGIHLSLRIMGEGNITDLVDGSSRTVCASNPSTADPCTTQTEISGPCFIGYDTTKVQLTANPLPQWTFDHWDGSCTP